MGLVGRVSELARIEQLVTSASGGRGGLLVVVGSSGSGKSALLSHAAGLARDRGLTVVGASPAGPSGRTFWTDLLQQVDGQRSVVVPSGNSEDTSGLDMVARALAGLDRHLIVVDDLDHGGPEALTLLGVLAGHLAIGTTAVLVSSTQAVGVGGQSRLGGLSQAEMDDLIPDTPPDVRPVVYRASAGMPGVALSLVTPLADRPAGDDPLVHIALNARRTVPFLEVDVGVVMLLEAALERATGDAERARVAARLARELLGDAQAGARRRTLVEEAIERARRSGDQRALADALDARLHALWDPAAAQDRLDAAAEIADLSRAAGDLELERSALFWRFVALMELARVAEAESALAAFTRLVRIAGDGEAMVMVTARLAMLTTLHGRFDEAAQLIAEVEVTGRQAGMADTEALVGTLLGMVTLWRGDSGEAAHSLPALAAVAREHPGHLYEAPLARVLAFVGRHDEAAAELQRSLPHALAGSGPRWVGAIADLSVVAAVIGDEAAARQLYDALLPYRGRLVIWGGANAVTGPATYYLGLLAAAFHDHDGAVGLLSDGAATAERVGALPWLAHILCSLADVLDSRGAPDDAAQATWSRDRALVLARQLDLTGLLRRLVPPSSEWTLRREPAGDWLLLAGPEQARLRDSRGLHHLRALLAVPPRVEVSALDLAAGGPGLAAPIAEPVLDRSATESYRKRLAQLDLDLDAADRAGDVAGAAGVEAERKALLDELRRSSGLGGRIRRTSDEADRARVNVTRTLRSALAVVGDVAPRAGAHLSASIRTGSACRYDPAEGGPTRWRV